MIGFSPVRELGFDGSRDIPQAGKVAIMGTKATRELPHTLRGIQLRTVGRQEVQGETVKPLLPPVPVQSGVVIAGVVGNHHHPSRRASAQGAKLLQELPAGQGFELARLPPEEEAAVAQADGSIIAHALAGGRVKQQGVPGFGRNPHLTVRTVLLKMHFVHGPEINRGVEA